MKTTIRLLITILPLLCLSAAGPKAQAVVPPPDGGYPNFTTAEGQNALFSLSTGAANTAVGWYSLFSDTTGSFNTATGAGALLFNAADENTAVGAAALLFNTTGPDNTATGVAALLNNTEGSNNTATGSFALQSNTTGNLNTATGRSALFSNTIGMFNTANGVQALFLNTDGFANTATGGLALSSNTTGGSNTANGVEALLNNTIGGQNTADGVDALRDNTSGNFNTAIGYQALLNATGSGNLALGVAAGAVVTTADGVIAIGTGGGNISNSCFIGNIFGVTSSGGAGVFINAAGQLGTTTSSRRFKDAIKPMDKASEAVFALKPVAFRYKKEIDPARTSQFGLVAEDVEKVNPDLVVRDKEGKPYSVRYDQVNAMLLNEFLKEHRKVQEQEATVAQLKSTLAKKETIDAHQQEQIEALTAGLQKVSAQLEASKPAPQIVNNP